MTVCQIINYCAVAVFELSRTEKKPTIYENAVRNSNHLTTIDYRKYIFGKYISLKPFFIVQIINLSSRTPPTAFGGFSVARKTTYRGKKSITIILLL